MKAASLPARIVYACVAFALSGWAAFYACMRWLPELTVNYHALDPEVDGYGIFKVAVCVGGAIALMFSLAMLTLPWVRHRKRRGRGRRMMLTGVVVVVSSVVFADQGFALSDDLLFAAWLTYFMTFTFVRYGLLDDVSRASSSKDYD